MFGMSVYGMEYLWKHLDGQLAYLFLWFLVELLPSTGLAELENSLVTIIPITGF